jgi:TolA-binding protein
MVGVSKIEAMAVALVVSTCAIAPAGAAAQDVMLMPAERSGMPEEAAPAPAAAAREADEFGYRAIAKEMLRLDDRLAALERLISQLVSQQDEDHRRVALLFDEFGRFRSDFDARLAVLAAAEPVSVVRPLPTVKPEAISDQAAQFVPVDRFEQALGFAKQQDWPNAELVLNTFIVNNPDDPRIPFARYHLGLAYLEQGQPGQAAGIFLELFETGAAAPFGADNLFALARALRALKDVDPGQVCSVYSEIDASYGGELSPTRRDELLDLRLEGNCGP